MHVFFPCVAVTLLLSCLSSELLASGDSGKVVVFQVLASPPRCLNSVKGIQQLLPEPSRTESAQSHSGQHSARVDIHSQSEMTRIRKHLAVFAAVQRIWKC